MKRFHLSNVFLNQAARNENEALSVIRDLHPWRSTSCKQCGKPTRLNTQVHVVSCDACGATESEWTGTILEDSRAALSGVLTALRAMGEANPGLRELESRTDLAYSTLDALRNKTRTYCGAWLNDRILEGDVEVDEVLLRGKKLSGHANPAIMVLTSHDGKTAIAVPIPDQKAATLEAVLQKHVALGARIFTNAWGGYNGLTALGYNHVAQKQAKLPMAHAATKSLRDWLHADNRKELYTSGKAAHWSLVYSHRHLKLTRADALLDACLPARPRAAVSLTHVVKVPLRLSCVERDAIWKRLHGQDLFARLLYKRAHAKLHNTVTSKAWRLSYARDTKLQAAAPSTLVGIIKREYAATNGEFKIAPMKTAATSTCPSCGHKEAKDPRNRGHGCCQPGCGLLGWKVDRDAISAANLMLTESTVKSFNDFGLRGAYAGVVLPANASDPKAGANAVETALRTAMMKRSPSSSHSDFVNVTVKRK